MESERDLILVFRGGFEPMTAKWLNRHDIAMKAKSFVVNDVFNVEETRHGGRVTFNASCSRAACSSKAPPYLIYLELNPKDRSLMTAHCTCVVRKAVDCKHVYAVIHYINSHGLEGGCPKESCRWKACLPDGKPIQLQMTAKPVVNPVPEKGDEVELGGLKTPPKLVSTSDDTLNGSESIEVSDGLADDGDVFAVLANVQPSN